MLPIISFGQTTKILTILPPSSFDKLDPQYRQKLLELKSIFERSKKAYHADEDYEDKERCHDAIVDFYNKFMMPKEVWDKTFELAQNDLAFFFQHTNIIKPSVYQFYYKQQSMGFTVLEERKVYDYKYDQRSVMGIEDLCFPHNNLEQKFDEFEKWHCFSFIPKLVLQKHEKMKALYLKIKAVEEDDEKWFAALLEADDKEFVEHNVEYRLGKDLTNKKLWKIYLEYLKVHDYEKLLQTYSKYCRFFLNDADMLEEYRSAVGSSKVRIPWKNPFDFEVYDENFFDNDQHGFQRPSLIEKPPLQCHFSDKNALPQKFPFKENLMHYILKNSSAYVLHNLYKCCKWFYLKNPAPICYKFDSYWQQRNRIVIKEQSILIRLNDSFIPSNYTKLFIVSALIILPSIPSNFVSRIYRCTAKYINISHQKMTDDELVLLLGHGDVTNLKFYEVKKPNNEFFILENIVRMLPKIKKLVISGIQCTLKTAQILCEIPFKNKIKEIFFVEIQDTLLEPTAFAEFIVKNVSLPADIALKFYDSDENFDDSFKEIVDAAISKNFKDRFKPSFYLN